MRALARLAHALLALAAASATAQSLESVVMPGEVIQGHAKYEADCKNCHVRFDKAAQTRLCLDCHKEVAADVRGKAGYHGRSKEAAGKECRACHTEHKGREARIAAFESAKFDHGATDYPLREAHAAPKVECRGCHEPGKKFRAAPSECRACHEKDDTHKGSLGPKCHDCHTERNWKEAKFDHAKTRFPLEGKHVPAKCNACHKDKDYKATPRECNECHRKDDHHKGRYGPKCETCHDAANWGNRFRHDTQTKYPLLGKHASVKCDSCHKGFLYRDKAPLACVGCHRADDVHKGSQGDKCERCHGERSWKTSSFDHDKTRFALRNKHKEARCEACHKPGAELKLPRECLSCHRKDDTHKGQYGEKCESCHNDRKWTEITFDHDRDTKYPLKGRHARAKCNACHTGHLFQAKLKSDCASCHRKDDKHEGQEGERCERCHGEASWKVASYDHSKSRFLLAGAHYRTECKACHKSLRFRDAARTCDGCHAKDDAHKKTLGTKCEECHNARSWKAWDFDHDRRSAFKLDGRHRAVRCTACHVKPMEAKVTAPTACFGCHAADDTHTGGFGALCERCHTAEHWKKIRPGMGTGR